MTLENVAFRYPGSQVQALSEVSLSVGCGGVTCVTGRMGAGTSTLLLVMAGLAPRTTGGHRSGRVETLGVDPATPGGATQLRGRVAVLLPTPWTQLSGMTYTVRDEVAFGPANLGWAPDRISTSVERRMTALGIEHLADRDPVTLSGGEMQRTVLAGLLAMEPELLLLDEPALELDTGAADRLFALLNDLSATSAIVVATTNQDRIAESFGSVTVLHEGRVVAHGASAEVLGSTDAVAVGASTSIGALFAGSVSAGPAPVTVAAAVGRLRA